MRLHSEWKGNFRAESNVSKLASVCALGERRGFVIACTLMYDPSTTAGQAERSEG